MGSECSLLVFSTVAAAVESEMTSGIAAIELLIPYSPASTFSDQKSDIFWSTVRKLDTS